MKAYEKDMSDKKRNLPAKIPILSRPNYVFWNILEKEEA
jgi:hypothetical protein